MRKEAGLWRGMDKGQDLFCLGTYALTTGVMHV